MIVIDTKEEFDNIIKSNPYSKLEFSDDYIKNNIKSMELVAALIFSKLSNNSIFFICDSFQDSTKYNANDIFYFLFMNCHFSPTEEMIIKYNLKEIQIELIKKDKSYYRDIEYIFPETKELIKLLTL